MTPRDSLRAIRNAFFAQKYRFDLGLQFLVFANFALLVLAASDKLKIILGLEHISQLLVLLVPLSFVGAWAFGYALDKIVKSPQTAEREALKRSVAWREAFARLDRIERKLDRATRGRTKW